MDEQSIWKKEISFRRKPKEKPAVGEESTSIWKKEISLRKKTKDEGAEPKEDATPKESIWKKEITLGRKEKKDEPAVAASDPGNVASDPVQVSGTEPGPEEPVWTKEVSFSRASAEEEQPVASEAEVVPSGDVQGSDPEPGPEETVWKREVSFSRASEEEEEQPEAGEAEVVPSGDVQGSDPEPGPQETVWKREVSFSRASEEEEEQPEAGEEEVVPSSDVQGSGPEPGPQETVWKREVSFSRASEEEEEEPAAAEAEVVPSSDVQGSDPEPGPQETVWKREVSFNRASAEEEEEQPAAVEAEVVPAGDVHGLDPEPGPEETVWKREVSFSRGAADDDPPASVETETPVAPEPVAAAPAPTVVHPPVPAAELPPPPKEAAAKVPFWKREISFGGKKEKAAKAERAPKAERARKPKQRKQPKQPKQPKERRARPTRGGGGKGAKRLVGLKIGASQLAAARVANNGSAELLQVARRPLEPGIVVAGELRDPDALAEALKDFFDTHKLPKRGVRLGIANNRIGVRTFDIAGIEDPKQLANAIRFRAQEALPIPIDEAVLDYQVLGEGVDEDGQPTRRVLLVVAYRELIDRYVDACKKAGVGLVGIDLEAFALLRALQAPQAGVGDDPSAALVAVAIGHERSTFAVSDGRTCEFTRVLEWGGSALNVAIARVLDSAPSEVEVVKRTLSLVDSTVVPHGLNAEQGQRAVEAARKAIQSFARELVSSLQYYQNQPGSLGIGEIVLTGGTAHLPGLADELQRLIGVRVRVGDPLARMKVSKKVGEPEQVGSLAVAIGLGIED